MAGKTNARILIIGAGISGLSAAERLQEKGVTDFIILEATDRVGGRIKTLKQSQDGRDYVLELGAGWIHNSKGNPVYKIAKENGLLKPSGQKHTDPRITVGNVQYRTEDGKIVPKKMWLAVQRLHFKALEKADEYFKQGPADDSSDLRTFIEQEVQNDLDAKDSDKLQMQKSILETLNSNEAGVIGCHDLNEVSLKQIGSYKTGENTWTILPRGYEGVIDVIRSKIPSEKIRLNCPVSCIHMNLDSGGGPCSVQCQDGQSFTADHVMMTASLGYLKKHASTLFDPPLPREKLTAIERLGFGIVNRIYIEFENLDFITERNLGEVFLVRDLTHGDRDEHWEDKLYSFYCQEVPNVNMLTTWLTGKQAEMIEKLSDDEIKVTLQVVLQKYLGVAVPMPTSIIRSSWQSDPFTHGSWSFMKLGSSVNDIRTLADPIHHNHTKQPVLLFAGEATNTSYYSSTHGALLSGRREADRLCNIITSDGT